MAECAECGRGMNPWIHGPPHNVDGDELCFQCWQRRATAKAQVKALSQNVEAPEPPEIMLTTETWMGGLVKQRLGVIASECVLGVNVLKDLRSAFTNITGGRSTGLQNSLKEAKQIVFRELKIEAHELGANAVIGIDLDYQELNGKGGDMLMLVASGTAVVLGET